MLFTKSKKKKEIKTEEPQQVTAVKIVDPDYANAISIWKQELSNKRDIQANYDKALAEDKEALKEWFKKYVSLLMTEKRPEVYLYKDYTGKVDVLMVDFYYSDFKSYLKLTEPFDKFKVLNPEEPNFDKYIEEVYLNAIREKLCNGDGRKFSLKDTGHVPRHTNFFTNKVVDSQYAQFYLYLDNLEV